MEEKCGKVFSISLVSISSGYFGTENYMEK
jgi:hypothetical protein